MGKIRFFALLKTDFIDSVGKPDSIAWSVNNTAQWKQEIEGRIHGGIIELVYEHDVKVA